MNEVQCKFVDDYFDETIYPILTPMAVDSARPFPLIRNKSLNICVLLKGKDEENYATVQVPAVVSRIVELPSDNGRTVILLEQIIERNIDKLFSNHKVICAYPYRITKKCRFIN